MRFFQNGDFTTCSNDVETVCRRVNPADFDGDFFGPANILPDGANTNAYCTVSLVATGPDTLVVFEGDGPSDYPDPRFVARHGETNEVLILIGKTYTVSSVWPIEFTGASDSATEIFAPLMRLRSSRSLRGENPQTHTVLAKLERISGPDLPLAPVIVPPETQVAYSIVYEGAEASDAADDKLCWTYERIFSGHLGVRDSMRPHQHAYWLLCDNKLHRTAYPLVCGFSRWSNGVSDKGWKLLDS